MSCGGRLGGEETSYDRAPPHPFRSHKTWTNMDYPWTTLPDNPRINHGLSVDIHKINDPHVSAENSLIFMEDGGRAGGAAE